MAIILPERKRLYLPGTPQAFTAEAYSYKPVLSVSAPGFNDGNVPGQTLTHAVRTQSGYSEVGWGVTGDGTSGSTSRYRYTHNTLNTQTLTVVLQVTPKAFNASYTPILIETTPNSNTNPTLGPILILPYHNPSNGNNQIDYWTIGASGSSPATYGAVGIYSPPANKTATIAVTYDRAYSGYNVIRAVYVDGVLQGFPVYGLNTLSAGTSFASSDIHINARGVNDTPSLYNYATLTHGLAAFNTADTSFAREISKDLRAVYRQPKRIVYFDLAAGGGASFLFSNTLSNVSNALGFEVSPKLSISNTLSGVSNTLSFSSAGSQFSITNTLENSINALSFEVSPELAIVNTLNDLANALSFSGAGSIVIIGNTLANISSALSFYVSPLLTLNNTLSDVTSSLSFTVNQSEFVLNNTLSNVTNSLSFSVASSLTLTDADIEAISMAVWSRVIEDLRADEMMRVMFAALAGKRSGIGTSTEIYYGVDGVKERIVFMPTDSNGNGDPVIDGTP